MYATPKYAQKTVKKIPDPVVPPTNQGFFAEPVMSVTGEITTIDSGDIVMTLVEYTDPLNLGGTEEVPKL